MPSSKISELFQCSVMCFKGR